jgi:hypothetical protein
VAPEEFNVYRRWKLLEVSEEVSKRRIDWEHFQKSSIPICFKREIENGGESGSLSSFIHDCPT